jgi:hypothetical protein
MDAWADLNFVGLEGALDVGFGIDGARGREGAREQRGGNDRERESCEHPLSFCESANETQDAFLPHKDINPKVKI